MPDGPACGPALLCDLTGYQDPVLEPRFRRGPDHPLAGFLGGVRRQGDGNSVRPLDDDVPCSRITSLGSEWDVTDVMTTLLAAITRARGPPFPSEWR